MSTVSRNRALQHEPDVSKENTRRSQGGWRRMGMLEPLESRMLLSVGGGFTDAGIVGEYFANSTLSGTPAFTRSDVRIDFDWGTVQAPGGSTSPGYADVAHDDFSVRWTGQVVPTFSENYTFQTLSDDGVRLSIKPTGTGTWTTVIDDWTAHAPVTDTGVYAMTAGATYDVMMEYYQNTGAAEARLAWSSPSTPLEVVDPAVPLGVNAGTAVDYDPGMMFADAMKMARLSGAAFTPLSAGATIDADGWLTGDGKFILFHGQNSDVTGRYTMTFTGQATVGYEWNSVTANSSGYDPVANITTVQFTINTQGALQLRFTDTRRLALDTEATGITNIKVMRPVSPSATTSYSPGTLFTTPYENLLSQFTAIRFMDYFAANSASGQVGGNSVVNWSDRTKPWYSSQQGIGGGYQGAGGSVEYAIAICNETSNDLWLNVPMQASDDYLAKLALAVKYGTDANGDPYTAAQANPVYAPLNPNLQVYLEYSNEVWNGLFYQASLAGSMSQAEVANNTANGQIINYDNVNNTQIWMQRWWILRTKQIGDAFRTAWGDAAMMTTIRPVFQFQYANANNTAANTLQFLENYFNNTDGNHVATPHPVNYYLYGAGGGWYNGVNDGSGLGGVDLAHADFETPVLAPATMQANPTGAGWTFTGTAGIASNDPARAAAPDGTQVAYIQGTGGFSQTVDFPAGVSDVTFYAAQGTTGSQSVTIYIDGIPVKHDWRNEFTPEHTSYDFFRTGSGINLTAGQHTIQFIGSGNGTVFIDSVKVESADQMLASGTQDVSPTVQSEVSWDMAYGLHTVGYEGGFTIGGDNPTAAGFAANLDPRVAQGVIDTMYQYQAAGGDLPIVFNATGGSYAMAMSAPYGTPNINYQDTPKMQGYNQVLAGLPAAETHGTLVPAYLTSDNVTIAYSNWYGGTYADTLLNLYKAGGWVSWNVIVPTSGDYTLTASATGTGNYIMEVDGQELAAGTAGTTDTVGQITLTRGLHCVRIRSTSSTTFKISQVIFSQDGAPAAPTLNSATDGNGSATLTWSGVTGAAGYTLRYRTASDTYPNIMDVGDVTNYTFTGLTNNQEYFFAVSAYTSAGGVSLPTDEWRVIPMAAGQTGTLLYWDFANYIGSEISDPTTENTSKLTVSDITRGSGLKPDTTYVPYYFTGAFASVSNRSDSSYGADLTGAIAKNQYYQFTVTPAEGYEFSLNTLSFLPYFQNPDPGCGAGYTYSMDGVNFSAGTVVPGTPFAWPKANTGYFTTDLSGLTDLQNVTTTATFRIYLFGNGNWEWSGLGGENKDVIVTGSFLPSAPSALAATPVSANQVDLSWTAPAGTIGGYNIYRGMTSGGESPTPLNGQTPITATTYSDTSASAGTPYYYTVKTVVQSGTSAASAETYALTLPGSPTELSALYTETDTLPIVQTFAGTSATNWGWDSKTDPNGQLSGTNQMTYTNNATVATNGSSFVTESIPDAATLFPDGTGTVTMHFTVDLSNYRNAKTYVWGPVIAELRSNMGNQSSFISYASGAIAKVRLAGGWLTTGRFGIGSWANGAYGGATGGASPLVTLPTDAVFDFTWTVTVTGSQTAGWTVTSNVSAYNSSVGTLTAPTSTYTDTLYSQYWSGLGSAVGCAVGNDGQNNGGIPTAGQSITFNSFSAALAPSGPVSFKQIALSWTAPTGTVSGYNIYRGTTSGGESATPLNGGTLLTSTTYTDTSVSADTTYYYTVKAVNESGNSVASIETSVTTSLVPAIANAGFDDTSVSTYIYDPTGLDWTFTGNAGIQADGSTWGAPAAPSGTQTSFLQSAGAGYTDQNGQFSQTLNFTSTGNYALAFQIAGRTYSPGGTQVLGVYLDGVLLDTFTPTSTTSWDAIQLTFNIAAVGNHTLMFAAMNSSGDQSLFLDDIHLTLAV